MSVRDSKTMGDAETSGGKKTTKERKYEKMRENYKLALRLLRCPICVDRRRNTLLPCGHVICQKCMKGLCQHAADQQKYPTCPFCRREFRESVKFHL